MKKQFDEHSFYKLLDLTVTLRKLDIEAPDFEVSAVYDNFEAVDVWGTQPVEYSQTPLYYEIKIRRK
jgi:hypothetical protein